MASPGTKYPFTEAPPAIEVTTDPTESTDGRKDTSLLIDTSYKTAFAAVQLPRSQGEIDKIEDRLSVPASKANEAYENLNTFYTANAATITSAAGALNLDVKSIENSINTFAETSAVLMKGLDALAQLHPFVGVAVMAFKLVVTLDITRRQNNKKVLAVKIQMQDLMTILFQLRHMRDPQEKGPDGATLTERFSSLMESIAKDITSCGSACDVYTKKSLIAKTLKSKIYESRLAGYATKFANHKTEIGFALKVHTALGVDAANKKLDGQDVHLKAIEEKMEALFRKLDTPRERDVQKIIDDNGGAKACIDNDSTLQELVAKSGETFSSLDPTRAGGGDLASAKKLLNKELSEDVDEAFKRNIKLFDRKMEMQSRQLTDTINLAGEHIISVLSGGAHEKILDTDLQTMWKDQGWKGSVKARYFVLALNDYYTDKFSTIDVAFAESRAGSVAGSAPSSPLMSPTSPAFSEPGLAADERPRDDRWALAYINVSHLQPILEAVDDDGTGFVSIKEANDFAVSRPAGWSLLSWVAFWAAGWHASVTWYKNRIYNIISAMLSLVKRIKPANIQAADKYLNSPAMQRLELLLRSTHSAPGTTYDDGRLAQIIHAYQDSEEKKLATQLDSLLYELDDVATLRLITGPRRIERYVYPLIFRLLKRHYDIMRLAAIHILDDAEWEVMITSLATVFKAVDERTSNLEAIFKTSSIDVRERLGNFAFGMFQLLYGKFKRDRINNTICSFEEEDGYNDDNEDLGPESDDDEPTTKAILARMDTAVLRHETHNVPTGVYNFETLHPVPPLVDPVDGAWTGQIQAVDNGKVTAYEGTLLMVLTRTGDKLSGAAENFINILEVTGTVDEERKVVIKISWPDGYAVECTGKYGAEKETIEGEWADADDDSDSDSDSGSDTSDGSSSAGSEQSSPDATYPFIFRRTSPDAYRFLYTPAQFTENPARARWGFAIAATIDEIQRKRLSWSNLKKRFEERRRFIELDKRNRMDFEDLTPNTVLNAAERAELYRMKADMRACDTRFYHSVVYFDLRHLASYNCYCDSCRRNLRDVRLICIQCMDDHYADNIDLCIECIEKTPERAGFVHTRSHVLVKTIRRIHDGEWARVIPQARSVADRVKKTFSTLLPRVEGEAKEDSHTTKTKSTPAEKICCCCGKTVSCPCWVCITCTVKYTYICADCDTKRATALPDGASPAHALSHPLVQIFNSDPIPEPSTTDSRLSELETKMLGLDTKMAALEEKLENRFVSLEALLQGMAEKFSSNR
ncbi:hypothetical protein B0H11DRAFT_2409490 [Mycena galericulata]|nr:hypothetical protein B0H11DRAFT_2409490 [Mycena galericulata]